jgi:uncharacterized membrane protein
VIRLVGILVVALGFALRWNPVPVVIGAAALTAWMGGEDGVGFLALMGRGFVDNRFMTLPVLLLVPVVAVLERNGLQERAGLWIRRMGGATAGRILWTYQAVRQGFSMIGLAVGGHASMVRPLIAPMAEAAAQARGADPERARADVRAHAAAAENWGNFFADDILVAVGPVLLMKGVFAGAGVEVSVWHLGLWGLPTALASLALGAWRLRALDRRLSLGRRRP